MARTKSPTSTRSFGGLDLDPGEEKKLQRLLKERGVSLNYMVRFWAREWLKKQHSGI